MKKTILCLIAAMLLAALAGCGQNAASGQDNAEAASGPAEGETQDEPSSEEPETQTEQLFDAMEIDVERGSLDICTGDSFSYVRKDGGEADYEIAGGVLRIEQSQDHKTVLTLPEGESYTSLRLTAGEGHVYAESALQLQTLELNVTRGEATVSGVCVADSSSIAVGQGSAFLSGDPGKSVAVNSREGHVSMEVSCAQDDYNFEIELSTGNIHLGAEDYHGLSFSKSVDNGAERSMELSCSRGDLSVDFTG